MNAVAQPGRAAERKPLYDYSPVNFWMNSSMAELRLVKPTVESSSLSSSAKTNWRIDRDGKVLVC